MLGCAHVDDSVASTWDLRQSSIGEGLLTYSSAKLAMNQNRALIIGVGADLPMTVTDAEGIASILADPARCGFDPASVQVLTGADATRERILAALDDLAAASEDAAVIVYFSGHGVESPAYHLLPYGYDLRDLPATSIPGGLFTEKLRAIRARKLLGAVGLLPRRWTGRGQGAGQVAFAAGGQRGVERQQRPGGDRFLAPR